MVICAFRSAIFLKAFMIFELENKLPKREPSAAQLRAGLLKLRSYGPSSYASLTDDQGNYLQVGGGGLTCLFERRSASDGRHYRAYLAEPSLLHPDGTVLAFSAGEVSLRSDEWIPVSLVIPAFTAFLIGQPLPEPIRWRDMTVLLNAQ